METETETDGKTAANTSAAIEFRVAKSNIQFVLVRHDGLKT